MERQEIFMTEQAVLVPERILRPFRDQLPQDPSELFLTAYRAYQAALAFDINQNPFAFFEGASRSIPNPSAKEVKFYNEERGFLYFKAIMAAVVHHINAGTEAAPDAQEYLDRLTSHQSEFEKCEAVINHLIQSGQLDKANAIINVIRPHLDVALEYEHLANLKLYHQFLQLVNGPPFEQVPAQ